MGAIFFLSNWGEGAGQVTDNWPLTIAVALVAGLASAYASWKQQEKSSMEQHAKDGN